MKNLATIFILIILASQASVIYGDIQRFTMCVGGCSTLSTACYSSACPDFICTIAYGSCFSACAGLEVALLCLWFITSSFSIMLFFNDVSIVFFTEILPHLSRAEKCLWMSWNFSIVLSWKKNLWLC